MKKIILADRERRREARLKSGETLKPLPLPPDEEIPQTADLKVTDKNQKILIDEIDAEDIENLNLIEHLVESSVENKALDSEKEKIEMKENDTSVESKGQR